MFWDSLAEKGKRERSCGGGGRVRGTWFLFARCGDLSVLVRKDMKFRSKVASFMVRVGAIGRDRKWILFLKTSLGGAVGSNYGN